MMVDPVLLQSGGVGCTMMVDPVTVTVWGCRVYYDGRPCNCYSLGV